MEITIADLVLFVWGAVATVLWQFAEGKNKIMGRVVINKFQRIASGELRVVDTGESIEFETIRKGE